MTSYKLGTGHFGGYSQIARVPAEGVVPLPKGLSLKEAMILGTAGFTAELSVQRLENNDLEPSQGPVLVAGATGGVGSIAVNILAIRGYEVVASTGKSNEEEYSVLPYISRGVNWLGIDSVECPMNKRFKVWNRLGDDLKPTTLNEDLVNEISLKANAL